uniref:Uncharacterized protein n=1 Tax=Onchocerca volvulus TaxID=6282 RepID=A0A8R1Y5N8_ONCVO
MKCNYEQHFEYCYNKIKKPDIKQEYKIINYQIESRSLAILHFSNAEEKSLICSDKKQMYEFNFGYFIQLKRNKNSDVINRITTQFSHLPNNLLINYKMHHY